MNLFSTRDPEEHRIEKRKVGNAYALPRLLESEQAIDSCIELFMSRLGGFADKGQSVDLGTWLQYFAFDVVGVLTLVLLLIRISANLSRKSRSRPSLGFSSKDKMLTV